MTKDIDPQTHYRYEVFTMDRHTDKLRLTHAGNDRDDATSIANKLDERQDTWFFDRFAPTTNDYKKIKIELAFDGVERRMWERLSREVQVPQEALVAAQLVIERWDQQLWLDKIALRDALAAEDRKA